MRSRALLLVLIAIAGINAGVALLRGVTMPIVALSLLIACGYAIVLQDALCSGSVHTMQDGLITYEKKPFLFLFVMTWIIAGYLGGLLAPWVVN